MDIDLWMKGGSLFVGAVGLGATIWKLRDEIFKSRRGHLRDDYRFAAEFLNAVQRDRSMHPYLKQKGYQALIGGTHLSPTEIEYLLTFPQPAEAVEDFAFCRKQLVHRSTAGNKQIDFANQYRSQGRRTRLKWLSAGLFVIFYAAAVSPAVLPILGLATIRQMFSTLSLTGTVFFPFSAWALSAGVRIARAERLVNRQHDLTRESEDVDGQRRVRSGLGQH